jgi:hypothetical protein
MHNAVVETAMGKKTTPPKDCSLSTPVSSPLAQHKFFPMLQTAYDALSKDESTEV